MSFRMHMVPAFIVASTTLATVGYATDNLNTALVSAMKGTDVPAMRVLIIRRGHVEAVAVTGVRSKVALHG